MPLLQEVLKVLWIINKLIGIGREFALDLAKKGFNLLIFDKDYQAMEDLKTQISQINSNLLVKIVEVDFSKLRTAQEYIDLT